MVGSSGGVATLATTHLTSKASCDGAVTERRNEHGHRWYGFDWDRVDDFLERHDFSDPHHTTRAWVAVLAALMMDYRYLYLN